MHLLPIYTLIISTAQTIVRGGEVTYYKDCKPPEGFTSGTYSTSSLLPIEKCCPQTDPCDDIQGYCTIKWALELWPRMCDHMTYDCKDFQCVCCVKCSEDKCSKCTETRGECKKECRPDEVEDKANQCSFPKCKCCKKCDIQPECQNAGGTCVGAYEDCPIGSFGSNTGCCGGCFCCKPACQPLPACSQVEGAYCSETDNCAGGFYACHGLCQKTKWKGGYEAIEKCYCCIPKWTGDYLSVCPADNITTIVSTPEYKVPDKGSIFKPNWSSTMDNWLTIMEILNMTQPTNEENIDLSQSTSVESTNTTQSTLSSTELLAIDTSLSGGIHGGGRPDGAAIPILPLREEVKKINKTEEVQITKKNIVVRVPADEIIKEELDKSVLLPKDVKANKKALVSNPLSSGSFRNKNKNKEVKKANKAEKVQIMIENIVAKVPADEIIKEELDRSILLPKDVKADKKALVNSPLSSGSLKNKNKNIVNERYDKSIKAKGKKQAIKTDMIIKEKSTTPDQKDIIEAINLLQKLLFKNKSNKHPTNVKLNEKNWQSKVN